MGCFSFKCKVSGKPIWSSCFDGDACRMFLLKDGKVIEEMHGHYDSYGRVLKEDKMESFYWETPWNEVCDLMFSGDKSNGIAVVLDKHWNNQIPTTRSEDDPEQGWGKKNGGGIKVPNPYHVIHNEETDSDKSIEFPLDDTEKKYTLADLGEALFQGHRLGVNKVSEELLDAEFVCFMNNFKK